MPHSQITNAIEPLEGRTLLAAPLLGVYVSKADGNERLPTTSGRGVVVFTRHSGAITQPLAVKYAVNGTSTATSGSDFQTLTGRVTIPANKRSVALNVIPIDDSIDEPTESVLISLKAQPAYTIVHSSALITIKDNDPSAPAGWWNTNYHFRAPLSVAPGSFARTDHPVETAINFTTLLSQAGGSGSLIEESIRVIETNASGTQVVDQEVPFQFDHDAGFDAGTNAAGTLVFIAKGSTAASSTRYYHVYFDTAGSFTAYSFLPQVITDENSSDEGQDAVKIATDSATYWLQKENGGFSSIEDTSGNDWLGFNPTPGSESGGEYRGAPNAVFPGGGFHAGFDIGSTSVIHAGPLKTTIESTVSVDKQVAGSPFTYKMRYEIYGSFVRATMVEAGDSYWFLYEGTPGGGIDANDTVVRSDGTVTSIGTSWNANSGLGNANGQEWAYFRDPGVNRYIYFVHDTPDNLKDSYYQMNSGGGSMTVFGFGRDNDVPDPLREKMTAEDNSFTFGIETGGSSFSTASATINGKYRSVALSVGAGQKLP